ncbi:TraC family protein [Rickettsia endosymbiont of Polydrusus tereticollis]|uniref:TraC family protein n=1 Tax=Rickettsia endosymbiont of Polydrusus tereticollis TaxID=3066251 RepID=UPI0031329ED5
MISGIDKDFARERLAKHFVYESYDEESSLFFNRASVGFVLLGWPLVGTSLQAQGEIAEFLKSDENLPAGSSFQILMIGSDHIREYLDNWQLHRKGSIFAELSNRRTKFLEQKAKEEGNIKDVVLLISVTIPTLTIDINEMIRRREVLQDTFKSIGLTTYNVEATLLLKFVRLIFGWREEEHPELNPYEILSEQISQIGKLVLTKGNPIKMAKKLNKPVFFDQGGVLTTRFKIKAVPAIARQEGKLLKISEIKIN